jgi:tetratricopeptide (TPR) repeat protein
MDEELNDLPPVEKARALFQRAHEARREGHDPFAHGFYTQALNLFRGHGDRKGEADALLALADLALHYNPTGQHPFDRRKALCEEALAIYRELGDQRRMARTFRLLASVVPKADGSRLLEESLALAREEGDKKGIADSLDRLSAHYSLRERAKAVALKEQALALYREIGDRSGEALVLFGLTVSHMNSDPARGQECAAAALRIYRELGHKEQVANLLLSFSYDLDEETQIAHYMEAREIYREIGLPSREATSLRRQADIAEKRGELPRAQALRAEADEIYPEEPIDPELLKAFEQAATGHDTDAVHEVLKRMF